MKNVYLYTVLVSGLLVFSSRGIALPEMKYADPSDTKLPEWVREMYSAQPDYGKMIDLHDAYYRQHQVEKNTHTQYYKRLLHDLSQDPYGDRFGFISGQKAQQLKEEYKLRREKAASVTGAASWTCIGPFDFDKDAASRSYAPGAAHVYTVEQSLSNTDVLYAGTATSGLWKSTDKGLNWSLLTLNYDFNRVYALEIDFSNENILYFGASEKMYKTTDGGQTFNQIGDPAFRAEPHGRFREIVMHPSNSSVLWAASDAGLYQTSDGGSNWTKLMSGGFKEIEFHPTQSDTMYTVRMISDTTEFYKSTDGGSSWVKKTNGWPAPSLEGQPAENKRVELAVTPADPERVYALATGKANGGSGLYGVYVSYDAGESWTFQCCGTQPAGVPDALTNKNLMGWQDDGSDDGGQFYYDLAFAVSPTNADSLYVAGVNMWYSANAGVDFVCPAKWSHPYKPNYIHADIHDIKIYGSDIWIACDGGVFYSTDGCQNVSRRMFGISGSDFWGFGAGFSNSEVMLGGTYHNGTMLKDENVYINDWVCIQGGDNTRGQVNPFDDRIVYNDGGRKRLSGDRTVSIAGFSYAIKPNKTSNLEFHPDYSKFIFSGVNNELRFSKDGGVTYTVLHDFGVPAGRLKVAPSNSGVIVVATYTDTYVTKKIYRSTDGGSSWTDITPSSTDLNGKDFIPYDFEIDDKNPDIIYLARTPRYAWSSWLMDGYKVYKTTDGGSSWTNITTTDLDGEWIVNIAHQKGTDGGIYLGTRRTVYYKNNVMSNWLLFGAGLPATTYSRTLVLDTYNNSILNGTNHSVYKSGLYETSTVTADFVAGRDTMSCSRDTVYFHDHSTLVQAGAVWQWSFPGAAYVSSTTVPNPRVVYGADGNYSVSLTVTDAGSNSDARTKTNLVTVVSECDADSVPGNALSIAGGAYDYVTTPSLGITTNHLTYTAWIKREGDQNDWASIVFSRGGSVGAAGLNFGYNNELRHHWNSGNYGWNSGLTVPDSVWTHVALVIEPDKATIYMNGEPSVHTSAKSEKTFDVDLNIGGDPSYTTRNFKGLIDEVCVYDTSLTQAQIRELMYRTVVPASLPHLIHYYQFNRQDGMATDRAGLSHGTFQRNSSREASSAPIPFNSVAIGIWSDSTIWNTGQNSPVKNWSRVRIETEVTLDRNQGVSSLEITPTGKLIISTGKQLTTGGN